MTILLGETQPVARTSHRCNLCNRVIHPGETYLRQRCIDGDPYVFKGCGHCLAAQAILDRIEPGWRDPYEGSGIDDFDEWYPSTVAGARIKVMWRRGWRRRDGSLYPVPGGDD